MQQLQRDARSLGNSWDAEICNSNNQKAESRGYDCRLKDSGPLLQHAVDGDGGYGVRQLLRNVDTDGQYLGPGRERNSQGELRMIRYSVLNTRYAVLMLYLLSKKIMTVNYCCCPGCRPCTATAVHVRFMRARSSSAPGLPGIFSLNQRTNDRPEELFLFPSQVSHAPQRSKPRSPVRADVSGSLAPTSFHHKQTLSRLCRGHHGKFWLLCIREYVLQAEPSTTATQ